MVLHKIYIYLYIEHQLTKKPDYEYIFFVCVCDKYCNKNNKLSHKKKAVDWLF